MPVRPYAASAPNDASPPHAAAATPSPAPPACDERPQVQRPEASPATVMGRRGERDGLCDTLSLSSAEPKEEGQDTTWLQTRLVWDRRQSAPTKHNVGAAVSDRPPG